MSGLFEPKDEISEATKFTEAFEEAPYGLFILYIMISCPFKSDGDQISRLGQAWYDAAWLGLVRQGTEIKPEGIIEGDRNALKKYTS